MQEINRDKLIRELRGNCMCLTYTDDCSKCAEKYPELCKKERKLFKAAADMLEADVAKDMNVPSKWEPISDPPPKGEVMAYSKKSGYMAVGYIEPCMNGMCEIEFICENGLEPLCDVTHWMPKPMPPEEG